MVLQLAPATQVTHWPARQKEFAAQAVPSSALPPLVQTGVAPVQSSAPNLQGAPELLPQVPPVEQPAAQWPEVHSPEAQSRGSRHVLSAAQGMQCAPPQSTSVSSPSRFALPQVVAGTHCALTHISVLAQVRPPQFSVTQWPAVHTSLLAQLVLHAPQCRRSRWVSAHEVPHRTPASQGVAVHEAP